jgi:hypothetical protein
MVVQEINSVTKEVVEKQTNMVHHYFIYNFIEHKFYDYPRRDVVQAMFKEKAMVITPKKDNVVVKMVFVVTTHNEIPKNVVLKEKEPLKNKSLIDWQEEEKLQHSFEVAIKDL